jgi:hypothetical protein
MDRTRSVRQNKKLIAIVSGVLVIFVVVFSIYSSTKIVVDLGSIDDAYVAVVKIDGSIIDPKGSNGSVFEKKIGLGKHKIEVIHPLYNPYEETVSVAVGTKKIQPVLQKIDERNAALKAYEQGNGVDISNPKFFGDDWIVFQASPKDEVIDGSYVVAKYDPLKKEWRIKTEGSAIFAEDISEPIPDDLRKYLETL